MPSRTNRHPSATRAHGVERASAPELDAILGRRFRVLDDGFVRVIDYLGSDAAVVQAARVSYGAGTKRVHEDRGLIRYLMRHGHTTPFEMCELKLHVRVPMDAWRQWIRHRTANVNEYSTRYSLAIDSMATTLPAEWRLQSVSARQGSAKERLDRRVGIQVSTDERALHRAARAAYQHRLSLGVAREQARKDLPLSTYTEAYWKIDLHNLLHFLELRLSSEAQLEIRRYAEVIAHRILSVWCPLTWEAFNDYRLHATHFSAPEGLVAAALVRGATRDAVRLAQRYRLLHRGPRGALTREGAEFAVKARAIGLVLPWDEELPTTRTKAGRPPRSR